jgi:hypothetical protein
MLKKHFQPYLELILNCISSSTTQAHLNVCSDMMYRFSEHFKITVEADEFTAAAETLSSHLLQKQHEING